VGLSVAKDRTVSDAARTIDADQRVGVPAIEVVDFGYTFPGRTEPTVRDVSFSLPTGSWTVVAGPTGSGKSTLLRALAGLIPQTSRGAMVGAVRWFGCDTRAYSISEAAVEVGLVLQSPDDQICTTTVEGELAFGLENLNLPVDEIRRRIEATAARFGLDVFPRTPTTELSAGWKQRLVLAAIEAMGPRILICDEPLSRLDPRAAETLLSELRRLRAAGMTIVTAEHRLEHLLPDADRVLVFDQGRLVDDLDPRDAARTVPALQARGLVLPLEDPTQQPWPSLAISQPQEVVAVQDLSFHYPDAKPIWSEVTFRIARGERIALLGPNGAGKSTLMAVLAGLLRPMAGRIKWRSRDEETKRLQPDTVLVPQRAELTLVSRTVAAELAYGPWQSGLDRYAIAERVKLMAERFALADLLAEPPQALSQGQRVRTAIAAAAATSPRLLMLDEPTTGQDGAMIAKIMETLSECIGREGEPEALLFSTHDLATAVRYADRVFVVAEGKLLAACTPRELLANEALMRRADLVRAPLTGGGQRP
jgi:energy-coupling factor transporter ATP-binding protein EcfA2